jgi:hypothetical protein
MRNPISLALPVLSRALSAEINRRLSSGAVVTAACRSDWQQTSGISAVLDFLKLHSATVFPNACPSTVHRLLSDVADTTDTNQATSSQQEPDIYRKLDSMTRLLQTLEVAGCDALAVFRRESLRRLYHSEAREPASTRWQMACCVATYVLCALSVDLAAVMWLEPPVSWLVAGTTTIVFLRLAQLAAAGQTSWMPHARLCPDCGRQTYARQCPVCQVPALNGPPWSTSSTT